MADKATLLQKLPPVAGESQSHSVQSGTELGSGVAQQADQAINITSFQAITYGSFVLTFILAGFAAVVLYRKALGDLERRIGRSAKLLAVVLALTALHGFVATYLYTNYLRNEIDSAPLSLTLLIWIILGAMTGYVSNRLIELKDKLKTSDAIIDATFYALVFACATLAVSPQIGPNAALILALLGLILCVVPFSRFFISCKRIKFNRRGSKRKPGRSVLYTLVSLPTLVPFFAILYVVELLSADLSLFFFNLISLSLVAYISFAMLSRMNNTIGNEVGDTDEAAEAVAEPARTGVDEPAAAPAMDPLIAELLAEEAAAQEEQPAGSAQIEKTAMVPPSKPGRPQARKEEKTQAAKGTANAKQAADAAKAGDPFKMNGRHNPSGVTLKVKAPSKPNKRF